MSYSSTQISGFDYIQMNVGNAKHSAHYFAHMYGFQISGYMGPETGVRDRVSYVLTQNDLMFVVTSAIVPGHPIHDFVARHGDGVREITVRAADPAAAYHHALARGAHSVAEPTVVTDAHGSFARATIAIYGDTVLSFVNREGYRGSLPGYEAYAGPQFARESTGLIAIDHIVGNVESGKMDYWAEFFENVMDLETYVHFDEGDISTQYSSLLSKVVRSKNSAVKFPINEPAEGLKKSQIDEYLETYYGPGVQHIAIRTENIIDSIGVMSGNGVQFIATPDSYYEVIGDRADGIAEQLADLKRLNILVDRDDEGYLLQLFTQPVGDRPTLFFEFIQRRGCEGFGQNNFQSLFEAIEREQAKRGNL